MALVSNSPHALIALLATASIGAIWSSRSPDFGVRAVTDRFAQIDPAVLVAVDGYLYNGRPFDVRPVVDELRATMPGLRATIVIPYLAGEDAATDPDNSVLVWDDLLKQHANSHPRHVPDEFIVIDEVPRTLSGKKCEVPVKKILTGTPPEQAISHDALADPDALQPFLRIARGSDS